MYSELLPYMLSNCTNEYAFYTLKRQSWNTRFRILVEGREVRYDGSKELEVNWITSEDSTYRNKKCTNQLISEIQGMHMIIKV